MPSPKLSKSKPRALPGSIGEHVATAAAAPRRCKSWLSRKSGEVNVLRGAGDLVIIFGVIGVIQ